MDYATVQRDERHVLEAIYMADYEEFQVKSAWNTTSDCTIKINLRSVDDEQASVTLVAKTTATYPRTQPLLEVRGMKWLNDQYQARIQSILKQRPAELLGEVMIHSIASEIQEAIEDAVQARASGASTSLDDERALHAARAQEVAAEERQAEMKRQQDAREAEEKRVQNLVQREMRRREQSQVTDALKDPEAWKTVVDTEMAVFEESIEVLVDHVNQKMDRVRLISKINSNSNTEEYLARGPGQLDAVFKVRRVTLSQTDDNIRFRDALSALERDLESLKKLRHPYINTIYSYTLVSGVVPGRPGRLDWTLTILSELSNRGSLDELLEDGQEVSLERVKRWSLDLLDALAFLHQNNILHKQINTNNVRLYRTEKGLTTPQLSCTSYNHRLDKLLGTKPDPANQKSWTAPEAKGQSDYVSRKVDVFDFGVLVVQMLFGKQITSSYESPYHFMEASPLNEVFGDLLKKFFDASPASRSSALDLTASEFFRTKDTALKNEIPVDHLMSRSHPGSSKQLPNTRRSRQNSSGLLNMTGPNYIRYEAEFFQLETLGSGAFGEVVRARHKVDGGIYAIKKVKSESRRQLEQSVVEVMMLSRLRHPNVVRYYNAWFESAVASAPAESDSNTTDCDSAAANDQIEIQFGYSSGGLDFVSSARYGMVQFGDSNQESGDGKKRGDSNKQGDTSEDDSTEDEPDDEGETKAALGQSKEPPRLANTMLFIQMELCVRKTLRNFIGMGLPHSPEDAWRTFRQILEGLEHIHETRIIHRDLKPENIFIDARGSPMIGDFGLATTGRGQPTGQPGSKMGSSDMTHNIGTALYIAPELQAEGTSNYDHKVDMYSLGIIFFEMCYSLPTFSERIQVLKGLRQEDHQLPEAFEEPERVNQGIVINSLINHAPEERPNSGELLKGDLVPAPTRDEALQQAILLVKSAQPKDFGRFLDALFSDNEDQHIKGLAWNARASHRESSEEELRLRKTARNAAEAVFRRHGAEEIQRSTIFPRTALYADVNAFQVIDKSGSVLQLAYDQTYPLARQVAMGQFPATRCYTFGQVFRAPLGGITPLSHVVVDFDIISHSEDDSIAHDAEMIKVLDEVVGSIPALADSKVAYHLNHAALLEAILDHCRVNESDKKNVKQTLSKRYSHKYTWDKIRSELRSLFPPIPSTAIEELCQFDFRDSLDRTEKKVLQLLDDSPDHIKTAKTALAYLRSVHQTLDHLAIRNAILICPLASQNEKLYSGSMLFQAIHDTSHDRVVLAAGGRYDSLVQSCKVSGLADGSKVRLAVGVSIVWDHVINASMWYAEKSASATSRSHRSQEEVKSDANWSARRCEVLVTFDEVSSATTTCQRLLNSLWSADISAELDSAASTPMDPNRGRDGYAFVVTVTHDSSPTVRVHRTTSQSDTEVQVNQLVSHIRSELSARNSVPRAQRARAPPGLVRSGTSLPETGLGEVMGLSSQPRSKRSNHYAMTSAAHAQWMAKCEGMKSAPIVAIETRDKVLELVCQTRLSDSASWRYCMQECNNNERRLVEEIKSTLQERRDKFKEGQQGKDIGLYNIKSCAVFGYDLSL